jgi:hypothetical protein
VKVILKTTVANSVTATWKRGGATDSLFVFGYASGKKSPNSRSTVHQAKRQNNEENLLLNHRQHLLQT